MREDDVRKLHSGLKSGDLTAVNEIIQKSPTPGKHKRLQMIPRKIAEAISEDDFVKWAATDFAGKSMPPVKIDAREMSFLSGGVCFEFHLGTESDCYAAAPSNDSSGTQVAS